jgi:hypothetical protein
MALRRSRLYFLERMYSESTRTVDPSEGGYGRIWTIKSVEVVNIRVDDIEDPE